MRFALIDNVRVEAKPHLKATCCCCAEVVIAKCGTRKIWHWAHKSKADCDTWWEPETAWHRSWKSNFPSAWQEKTFFEKGSGEKHIADVCSAENFVIEFQHSHIEPNERVSREKFYKNMVWVVDGTRLKRDFPRFLKGRKNSYHNTIFYKTENPNIFKVDLLDWCFPEAWIGCSVPVVFDFKGIGMESDPDGFRDRLYCLFPQVGKYARVVEFSHKAFINAILNEEWALKAQNFIADIRKQDEPELLKDKERQRSYSSERIVYAWRGIPLIGGKKEYLRKLRRR